MTRISLSVNNFLRPQILAAEKDFLVVYKPPRMHSAPLARSPSDNLLTWCAGKYPDAANLSGRRAGEGGLLHRLDFETQGLLLVARTVRGMESLIEQQKQGNIVKEYCALVSPSKKILPGFPHEKPEIPSSLYSGQAPVRIQSAFRTYGFGRKAVRPALTDELDGTGAKSADIVLDAGKPYTSDLLEEKSLTQGISLVRLRIYRGFRHQIRCHLAWLAIPILNDDVYGGAVHGKGLLGLRAYSISLNDPALKIHAIYSIPVLDLEEI